MLSKVLYLTTLLLSIATPSLAYVDVWSTTQLGAGASINFKTDLVSSTGFDATFYAYPTLDILALQDKSFINGGYSSNSIETTANKVTDPNFSFNGLFESRSLYGALDINMLSVLIELKGYFLGTYALLFPRYFRTNTN